MTTITGSHTITPTCDGRSSGVTATAWGMTSLPCNATTGLTTWTDTAGQSHRACYHHLAGLRSRYPERYVSEIADDPLGQAKARYQDRDELAGTACWHAGHVPGCAGRVGGEHELLPGWVSMEIDGETVEVEVS